MLRYEKFMAHHIPIYYEWRNNPEISQYDQPGFVRPMGVAEVEAWSERMVEGLTFMVYDDETPIGVIAFMNLDDQNRHAELSIVIGNKDYWSKGYGSQIMEQQLKWGFHGLNLNRLYLHVFDFNKRAIALYEKMGFTLEGRKREMLYRDGAYMDVLYYGFLRSEYDIRMEVSGQNN